MMTDTDDRQHRSLLQKNAHRAMLERGLLPDFPVQALAELNGIHGPATRAEESTRDLRDLPRCSIDNDDSRDIDQLTVAEAMPDGTAKVMVAIADVDAVVKKRSALDDHARQNTTSVYTVAETFPMLPEKLSTDFTSLNDESDRLAGTEAAQGRVILAHLGNGASLAAVRDGKSIDTSMGFTPTAGLVMSSRSGDLDPGLVSYLARTEQMSAAQFQEMVNRASGLLGVSETSSDMHDLLDRETQDVRAAEAVALSCYQVKKWIDSFAAALGGLDTLVFAGGIGENAPLVRARVCEGLGFLGIELEEKRNTANEGVISAPAGRVAVRVIRTDEGLMIARTVCRVLGFG